LGRHHIVNHPPNRAQGDPCPVAIRPREDGWKEAQRRVTEFFYASAESFKAGVGQTSRLSHA
jgi:hypothetical protein